MAKIDVVTIKGKGQTCFNLTESVGPGGRNNVADVILIQAYLRYISTFDHLTNDGEAVPDVPKATGTYTARLANAISHYQRWASYRLLSSDGRIDPASYEKRNIKDVFKPLMTITYLHIHARNAARFYAHPEYVDGMIRSVPGLLPMIALQNGHKLAASFRSLGNLMKGG